MRCVILRGEHARLYRAHDFEGTGRSEHQLAEFLATVKMHATEFIELFLVLMLHSQHTESKHQRGHCSSRGSQLRRNLRTQCGLVLRGGPIASPARLSSDKSRRQRDCPLFVHFQATLIVVHRAEGSTKTFHIPIDLCSISKQTSWLLPFSLKNHAAVSHVHLMNTENFIPRHFSVFFDDHHDFCRNCPLAGCTCGCRIMKSVSTRLAT